MAESEKNSSTKSICNWIVILFARLHVFLAALCVAIWFFDRGWTTGINSFHFVCDIKRDTFFQLILSRFHALFVTGVFFHTFSEIIDWHSAYLFSCHTKLETILFCCSLNALARHCIFFVDSVKSILRVYWTRISLNHSIKPFKSMQSDYNVHAIRDDSVCVRESLCMSKIQSASDKKRQHIFMHGVVQQIHWSTRN